MIFDVINPSDACTFETDDHNIAAVVCILLGNGQYGLECPEDETKSVPIFMFGGFEKWWSEHAGDIKTVDYIEQNTPKIAEALESCMCLKINERNAIKMAKEHMSEEEFKKYIMKVNDDNRSSMNNICGRAFEIAQKLREKNPNLPVSPRQVYG